MSPFLLDSTITLGLRLLRGERVTEAHSQHVYQRLARHWGGHLPVVLGLLVLQALWLTPLAVLLSLEIIPSAVALFLGLIPQLAFIAKATRIQ
jgi:Fuc2NAc and GlcNAc transferase